MEERRKLIPIQEGSKLDALAIEVQGRVINIRKGVVKLELELSKAGPSKSRLVYSTTYVDINVGQFLKGLSQIKRELPDPEIRSVWETNAEDKSRKYLTPITEFVDFVENSPSDSELSRKAPVLASEANFASKNLMELFGLSDEQVTAEQE